MERRADPRRHFGMKAFAFDDGDPRVFETQDVSAGGVFLAGDPGCGPGQSVTVRLELLTESGDGDLVYPLDASVAVVRVRTAGDGGVDGFGARWEWVECSGDVAPLREFLRRVLGISSGFVEAFRPGDAGLGRTFAFVFPKAGSAREGPEREVADDEAPPEPGRVEFEEDLRRRSSGVYVLMPVTFDAGQGECDARAIKLGAHGMRLTTSADQPSTYRRVIVRIPMLQRDKPGVLQLVGSVVTVRPGVTDHQFEVQFSLGNEPDVLATYRLIVEHAGQSLRTTKGL